MGLEFNYCECGCHGHEASAGVVHYWIFNDLQGSFYLHQGHGRLSPRLGAFVSFEAAEREANAHVRAVIKKMTDDLGEG